MAADISFEVKCFTRDFGDAGLVLLIREEKNMCCQDKSCKQKKPQEKKGEKRQVPLT